MSAPSSIDLRLALPVSLAWMVLGIVLAVPGALLAAAVTASVVCAVTLVCVASRRGGRWRAGLTVAALAAGAAVLLLASAAASVADRRPEVLLEAAQEGRHVTIEATLTQAVVNTGQQVRVRAALDTVRIGGDAHGVDVPVTLFAAIEDPGEVGDRVEVAGTLVATDAADASAFLVFARGPATLSPGPAGVVSWAGDLREGFRALVADMPDPGAGLLPGLAIGDTSAVDASLEDDMKASSLTHLTAVSGANCAIVVGLVLAIGAGLRLPRMLRVAIALAALALFVLIVTPEPSVLRASVMAVAVLVAMAWGRGAAGVPVLSLAVLILLTIDPWLARSYGFALSVLATVGLLVLARPLASRLARVMPMPVAAVIAVPLAAQLACQPVIILLAPTIPVYGVVANLLAGPAAPAATVLGLVACVAQPVAPALATLVAWTAWAPSAWIAAVAEFFSGLPGAQLPWAEGALGFVLAAVLTILGLGMALARRRRWWALTLSAVLVVVGGVVAGERLRAVLHIPRDWQFAACDVGQGDAHLIRDGDAVMLVDTGEHPAALEECLSTLGVARIETLVLTHFDLDHVGAVEVVLGRVGTVLAGPPGSPDDDRMLQRLADAGAEVVTAVRGTAGSLGRLGWSVLWPARTPGTAPGNDASVVLAIDGAACTCPSSLLLGDLGQEAQLRMLAGARAQLAALGGVDVVKVSHHGSADQSDRVYEAASASLGVIGVGAENTYGHPAPSILATLDRAGTTAVRTDLHGLVLVSATADGALSLWTERGG